MNLQERIDAVVRDLAAYNPEKVILFGSCARQSADEYSDMDLVIIKETQDNFLERSKKAVLLIQVPGAVDIFVYTPEEFERMKNSGNPFMEKVLEEGKVIYEKR